MYHYYFYLIILIPLFQLSSQSAGIKFEYIGIEQGLSQSTVYAITQDHMGFLWFGTQDGLNRYDGYSIKIFRNDPNDSNSVSDNTIWSLLSAKNGDLWIGTARGGINRYIPSKNRFFHYKHDGNDSNSISDNFVTTLFEDSKGNIWAGTRNKGLNHYNRSSDNFSSYVLNENDSLSISSNTVWSICEDSFGNIWVGTSRGISMIRDDDGKVSFANYLSNKNVLTVSPGQNGIIWAGTWGSGLYHLDQKSGLKKQYSHSNGNSISSNFIRDIFYDNNNALFIATADAGLCILNPVKDRFNQYSDDALMTIYKDNSGIFWLGTFGSGIKIYNPGGSRFRHFKEEIKGQNNLNNNIVFALLKDSEEDIWSGTYNGLKRYSRDNSIRTYLSDERNPNSLSNNKVLSLLESSDGNIWIGTQGGLNNYDKRSGKFTRYVPGVTGLSYSIITALSEDADGNLWIGNDMGGIDIFHKETKTFSKANPDSGTSIGVIYHDNDGIVWVGTVGGGAYKYVPDSNAFSRLTLPGNTSKTVYSILRSGKDLIWFGTQDGLIQFNPATMESRLFTTKEGLPNNIIWGILEDNAGNLWLSTNSGLSRFNINMTVLKNYNFTDGLQSNEFNRGAYFGNKKELLFGGMNGFNSFEPESISDRKFIPPVYITTFKVFDKQLPLNNPVPDSQRIELAYSQNFFSFEFVALNYSSPEKNQYAYKLEGFDREWHTVSALRRYASYTNLDPGEYLLLVRGSNNDGEWNMAGHSLFIIIKPPFWMTWWFRISALLFFAGIAAVIYNYRIRKLRELDQMRLRIASDLHDEVGSDLGGIALISQRLCRNDSLPAAVSSDLNEIKKASFQTAEKLRDIIWFVNPEHDLSEHLVLRLKDLAGRLLKESEFSFTVGERVSFQNFNLESRRQIFLIFKEVVHNIVKHACAENVRITMEQNNRMLKIEISDDGKGFSTNQAECPGANARGMGIKNIKRRAQAIGAELNISSSKDSGTTVVLRLRMP